MPARKRPQVLQAPLAGTGLRVAVAVARCNEEVSWGLLEGALARLTRQGVAPRNVVVAWVPGAFELPLAALALAAGGRFDAVVCLGAVLRGETPHFDYICAEAARGIQEAALRTGVPVAFGVLTCDTLHQARARSRPASGNKGAEAASAALEMVALLRALPRRRRSRSTAGNPARKGGKRRP